MRPQSAAGAQEKSSSNSGLSVPPLATASSGYVFLSVIVNIDLSDINLLSFFFLVDCISVSSNLAILQ